MAEAGPYLVPGEDLSVKRQLYLLRVFGGGKLLLVIIHEAVALLDDRIQACGLIRKPHILFVHRTGLLLSFLVLGYLLVIGKAFRYGRRIFRGDASRADFIITFANIFHLEGMYLPSISRRIQ